MRFASGALLLCVFAGAVLAQQTNPPATNPPATTTTNPPAPEPQVPKKLTDEDKAAIKQLLNEAIVKGEDHPFQITCSATAGTCNPTGIFISAAALSSIKINDFPQKLKALSVLVTAGETLNGEQLIVRRVFNPAAIPDEIVIAVTKPRLARGTIGAHKTTAAAETPVQTFLKNQSTKPLPSPPNDESLSDDPVIGFAALGTSESLTIQLQMTTEGAPTTNTTITATTATTTKSVKTITAGLQYQRWFIDMGGFITFGFAADEELTTQTADAGNVRILKKRTKDKLVPGTGIVLNFHPANYPSLAAQFGLATSVDRAASYYVGLGYRLRELGPRTLATFAAGIAATQVKRFPDVSVGDVRPATAPEVTDGSKRYVFGPYLSLSLGFSFGGVEPPPPQTTSTTTR